MKKLRKTQSKQTFDNMEERVNKSIAEETAVVILAAGKGTRMGREDQAKVCFAIDGVPAIQRIIEVFQRNRFEKLLVVVGQLSEQVMQAVGEVYGQAMYVFQSPQLGTGHAARVAAGALQSMGHTGPVLLTMGDKYIESEAVEMLVEGFIKQQADLALLTIPRSKSSLASSGRVFMDKTGQVMGIIERIDMGRQGLADELRSMLEAGKKVSGELIQKTIAKWIADSNKVAHAVPELLQLVRKNDKVSREQLEKILNLEKYRLRLGGQYYQARQIERQCNQFNPSLYLFRAEAFYRGVAMIDNNNAQNEYYLTDVVKHLGGITDEQGECKLRIRAIPATRAEVIQGFNSPDELLAIQDYVRRNKKASEDKTEAGLKVKCQLRKNQYCSVKAWMEKIEEGGNKIRKWLREIYGAHEELHEQKQKELLKVLKCYGKHFGFDEKVVIVRAPGRINLMGRHVDHRGGCNNFLALHRETIAVAGLREDDTVKAVNTEPRKFKPQQFSISELMGRFAWSDWWNFVNSEWVHTLLHASAGEWGNYIKAAMLRVQHKYQDLKIRGMNVAVSGNVPMAAGLSSSSTLVVATLRATIGLNSLELTSNQFIDLCGEGEWFVGSRGGAGDHAAITLGQRGKIAQVGYLPFRVEKIIEAPQDYQVIIADSHIKAAKSAAAKHQFNSKIAGYNLGLALLKQRCPEISNQLEHLRDLNPVRLGCDTSDIYRMLLKVPEKMTRKDFKHTLSGEYKEMIEVNFASHRDPGTYPVRGVLLFGAAECMRSSLGIDYLERGDIERFGQLMKISHDGDRVSRPGADGKYEPWQTEVSEVALSLLINDLNSEDPERVLRGQLYMQPGGYACSTEEIDRMVDIACGVKGVAGAQIAGAGLGGCIMILARKEAKEVVRRALIKDYYRPRNLTPSIINCVTVEGACLADF